MLAFTAASASETSAQSGRRSLTEADNGVIDTPFGKETRKASFSHNPHRELVSSFIFVLFLSLVFLVTPVAAANNPASSAFAPTILERSLIIGDGSASGETDSIINNNVTDPIFKRAREVTYIFGTDSAGVTRRLAVDRTPALYTGDFGDCLGGQSLFNITKFDAAYYADNMTVLFHLDGTTSVRNESLMLVITMEAYDEVRYTQTFDPCFVNMLNLCPLDASVPIMGYASFSLGTQQTAAIPAIALSIPDFDGYVTLQIFANSTKAEIGCFQAVMTNGNTVGLPYIIAPTVGAFVALAIVASFATATYGMSVPLMRVHYAHSLSVLLIIETLQTIFLTGALSLHWPSVLVAWWSNFGWSVGLIGASQIVKKVGPFAGVTGNASQVGGAGSTFVDGGGGQLSSQIYGRSVVSNITHNALRTMSSSSSIVSSVNSVWRRSAIHDLTSALVRRKVYNASDPFDYAWGGDPVVPGVPLPGRWQSFAGTLSDLNIPGDSAFTISLIWMVMAVATFPLGLLLVKGVLELLSSAGLVQRDRLAFFRIHYRRYAVQIGLRVYLAAFSPLATMAVFQFTLSGTRRVTALAAIVFTLLIVSFSIASILAIGDGIRRGGFPAMNAGVGAGNSHKSATRRMPTFGSRGGLFGLLTAKPDKGKESRETAQPAPKLMHEPEEATQARKMQEALENETRTQSPEVQVKPEAQAPDSDQKKADLQCSDKDQAQASEPQRRVFGQGKAGLAVMHGGDGYIMRHSWLMARYRTGCWWFFAMDLFFKLVRACVLGGGGADNNSSASDSGRHDSSAPPTAQVIVLLLLDVMALALYGYFRPLEGRRNIAFGVWVLCLTRLVVTALCVALLPQISISRIGATVVGFVILVIQVLQVILMLVLVVVSCVTSWLSLTRNQVEFQSDLLFSTRQRYLETLLASATGAPRPQRLTWRAKRKQHRDERRALREAKRQAQNMPPPEASFNVLEVRRAPKIEDLHFGGSDSEDETVAIAATPDLERGLSKASSNKVRGSRVVRASGGSVAAGGSTDENAGDGSREVEPAANNAAHNTNNGDNGDLGDDKDTLGDLGDIQSATARRRRTNSGSFGDGVGGSFYGNFHGSSSTSLGGHAAAAAAGIQQIYDPGRVIARHNRSRTNSMTSMRSLQSASGSVRWTSGGAGGGDGGGGGGRASPSAVGGGGMTASPGPGAAGLPRPMSMQAGASLERLASTPPLGRATSTMGRMMPTTAGLIGDRMTPTRETLKRHASERWSLPPPPTPTFD